jgi:nitrite reductase/ring-hydroxylating ferredoxin subunit
MNQTTATELNRRLLRNLQAGSTDTGARAGTVAGNRFTDPDILAREREALFLRTPQPVAFSGEVPDPGSYLALDVLDVPVLLSRDGQGTLHAFINACAHRGALVASGSGTARSHVCPFHGWSYQPDGRLRGRPGDEHFETAPEDHALTPLPVSERHGVVVIGARASVSQAAVDAALEDIGDELASYGFDAYRALERRTLAVNANWKLVNDLSLESYHFRTLHRDSVAEVLAPNAVVDTFTRHSRWAFPLQTITELGDLDEARWPAQLQGSVTYTLYPGVMLIANSLGAQMIRAEPGDRPDATRVSYVGVYAPGCDRDAAHQAYRFGGDVFANEDLPAARDCQRGIAARGGDFPLGRNEPLLQFWHGLWEDALRRE